MLVAGIEFGTVVPPGKVRVTVSLPATSAPPELVVKGTMKSAATPVRLGVTVTAPPATDDSCPYGVAMDVHSPPIDASSAMNSVLTATNALMRRASSASLAARVLGEKWFLSSCRRSAKVRRIGGSFRLDSGSGRGSPFRDV